nr:MAG TPA: hypothetical protein [Caudoviricetes sp.]
MGRLIDEDEVLKRWNELSNRGRTEFDQVIVCMPTAYDVDAVVEQLEEYREEMEQFNCVGMLPDMIEVVKAGGMI